MVKVVTVDLINDSLAEGREYFDLKLSSPVGATLLAQPTGRASIGANDAPAAAPPLIMVADAVADESSTFLEFVVSLSAPSTQAVSVSYNNSNLTALNGSDYSAPTSTLTFAPGETTKVVTSGARHHRRRADRGDGAEPVQRGQRDHRPAAAIGSIYDNDQTSGTPLIRVQDQIIDEAAGQATSSSPWTSPASAT